ncbi:MAG: hypothetical protein ACRDWD_05665 [Acidimicrobiia bacterium]
MRSSAVFVWLLRIVWLTLPLTTGDAVSNATGGWSTADRVVAAVLLWSAWGAGVVATLAPRPWGLTTLRTATPCFVGVAIATAVGERASAASAAAAVGATMVAGALAATPEVGRACAEAVAYGDERRFPLKVPPALFLGPLPLAVALVAAGVALGPLLLADGRVGVGIAAVVIGFPVAALLARALHGLSRRWAVLVPAGLVVADPLTLPDPVLITRDRVATLTPYAGRAPEGATLDLRLGAVARSVLMALTTDIDVMAGRRIGRGATSVPTRALLFSPVLPEELLLLASERRITVRP